MRDVSYLGSISEGMQVLSADGQMLGVVSAVWGGLADLGSTLEMEKTANAGAPIQHEPDVSDLPEGTTPVGETTPGYLEVESLDDGTILYVPLADLADVTGEQVLLRCTYEGATSGAYAQDPSQSS